MPVPYTFGTATASIPLSQLDSNFATAITIGNTAVQLGNTVTTLNNMTLANVTISSGNVTITNVSVTTANVSGTANVSTLVVQTNQTVLGNTTVTGNVTAALFSGSGASLSSLNASNVASGTIATARLASGTASSSTYLRGDQTWATITGTSPGGSTTQVQYNSSGSFAGSANLTFDGTTLTAVNNINVPNTFGFKNRIINGAMGIWQRGTSAALSNSYSYLTADRWETDMGGTAAATASQSTSVPTATTQYSLKIQRTAASTSTGNIVAAQALETSNSYDLAGSNITLSFWAKCGANYSASNSNLTSFVFFGTGTDQSMSNMRSNAWTGQTNASQNNTVSTTWTRFSQTVACPAGTTQVGMQFLFSPTGTAGADDSIYITGVQLEKGSTATSFDYRPYGTELALCQRYLPAFNGITDSWLGVASSTSSIITPIPFAVPVRTPPTGITISNASHFQVWNLKSTTGATTAITFSSGGTDGGRITASFTAGTPTTATGDAVLFNTNNASAQLLFTGCEL